MADAWTFSGEPASDQQSPGTTTLLDGTTFCISNSVGDLEPGGSHGLYIADTRFVSAWRLRIDGLATGAMSVIGTDPSGGIFVSRVRPSVSHPGASVLVARERYVGEGMSELVTFRNLTRSPIVLRLAFEVAADFAHLFEVKEERVQLRGFHSVEVVGEEMRFDFREGRRTRRLSLAVPDGAEAGPGRLGFVFELAGGATWSRPFEFTVRVDDVDVAPRHRSGQPGPSLSAAGYRRWTKAAPTFEIGHDGMDEAIGRSVADLGALRIEDHELDQDAVIAAGAPWYMAMFGRDSLLTSQMALMLDPTMASGTLRALARHQGKKVDDETEEQPGRILHEMRFRIDGAEEGPSRSAYYGSIDATPLFVCLLGEAVRFGLPREELLALLPAADRALEWIDRYGDRDGDGFVEYERLNPLGLINQGWKDSVDGINFGSGAIAAAPIALVEVQGYVYAARLARAAIADALGDQATAARCRGEAATLRAAFNDAFWVEARDCFAVALDGGKQQVDSVTSNIGHVLWTGIADEAHAAKVAARLLSPELFSGFGVRTLSSQMGAYNPLSYHNGTVWPHDTAIAIAGLARYGYFSEAETIGLALVDAAGGFSGRLPELFCGFSRDEFATPIADPASCSPQAWASASLLLVLRSFLGFEPDLPNGVVRMRAQPPAFLGSVHIAELPLGPARVELFVDGGGVRLEGLPAGVELVLDDNPSAH